MISPYDYQSWSWASTTSIVKFVWYVWFHGTHSMIIDEGTATQSISTDKRHRQVPPAPLTPPTQSKWPFLIQLCTSMTRFVERYHSLIASNVSCVWSVHVWAHIYACSNIRLVVHLCGRWLWQLHGLLVLFECGHVHCKCCYDDPLRWIIDLLVRRSNCSTTRSPHLTVQYGVPSAVDAVTQVLIDWLIHTTPLD